MLWVGLKNIKQGGNMLNNKNNNGNFYVYMPSFNLIHVHWNINDKIWHDIIKKSVIDIYNDPVLILRLKAKNKTWTTLYEVEVFGKTNNWIMPIKRKKRYKSYLIEMVTFMDDKSNNEVLIFQTNEFYLPIKINKIYNNDTDDFIAKDILNINGIYDINTDRLSS